MPTEHHALLAAARALDEAFVRNVGTGQFDQLVATIYADDALLLPPNVPLVQGSGQIRELYREMFEAGLEDPSRETTLVHVEGDLGYGVGTYRWTMRAATGESLMDYGKFVVVYRRDALGLWRVSVDMFSSDLPASTRVSTVP